MSIGQGDITFSQPPGSSSSGVPAPPNHSIQFNNAGLFGGSANLLWDPVANQVQVIGTVKANALFLPLSDNSGVLGDILVNGNSFINTYEPVPIVPGSATSLFIGTGTGNFGASNTGSIVNIGIGFTCMAAITTAENNVGLGVQTLLSLTNGFNNLGIGSGTLEGLTTGNKNTAVGTEALQNCVVGSENTAIGTNSGNGATGSDNIFLGIGAGSGELGDNKLYIGIDPGLVGALPFIYGQMDTLSGRWNAKLGVNFKTALPGLPTAQLHIAAGTAAAGTGPLKLTPGPLVTVPEDGLIEYDGINYWKTIGAVRTIIA